MRVRGLISVECECGKELFVDLHAIKIQCPDCGAIVKITQAGRDREEDR
jgi:predicted RNA-binding Zn-ribbon protein involved in translation (DUF1610 family)